MMLLLCMGSFTSRHQQTLNQTLAVLTIHNKNIVVNAYFILLLNFNFLFSFIYYYFYTRQPRQLPINDTVQ
jgi:hypothetical protein